MPVLAKYLRIARAPVVKTFITILENIFKIILSRQLEVSLKGQFKIFFKHM